MKALLDAYPDAAREKDARGRLPKDLTRNEAVKALLSFSTLVLGFLNFKTCEKAPWGVRKQGPVACM